MKPTKRVIQLLNALSKSPTPMSAKELSLSLGISYQMTMRDLKQLSENQHVKRLPGKGNSYNYRFISWPQAEEEASLPHGRPFSANEWGIMSQKALTEGFIPKAIETYAIIIDLVRELRTYADALSVGESIPQYKLDILKKEWHAYTASLAGWTRFVNAVNNTPQLWDIATLGEFK